MITPDMIPDEVVDALWRNGYDFGGGLPAQRMKFMRAAIAAALNAWPGRSATGGFDHDGNTYAWVQIPLKQDASA